ncbi:TMEM175 family protein [Microbacterium sp. HMH0099]|uniref:TMEM175 family protein n=1 Tax=Microbacterium sp. HMH0099 TaxID=3414026 RepID=UPI003BF6E059
MIRRRSHPDASVSTRRTEAFTDGVFAIAATLLVLGLTDRSLGDIDSDAALADALIGLWHPLFTFAVGFLILCLMWMTHVQQFEHLVRIDAVGMWINTVRLLFIVLVPFTSSLNTAYADEVLGRVLLPVNFFVAILLGWVQWLWARRSGAVAGLSDDDARRASRAALSAVLLSAVVVLASPWIGSAAFLLFVLDGPLTRLLHGDRSRPADGERSRPADGERSRPADGEGEGRG